MVHALVHAPRVFTLQLAWQSHHEEPAAIAATLASVDERVRGRRPSCRAAPALCQRAALRFVLAGFPAHVYQNHVAAMQPLPANFDQCCCPSASLYEME